MMEVQCLPPDCPSSQPTDFHIMSDSEIKRKRAESCFYLHRLAALGDLHTDEQVVKMGEKLVKKPDPTPTASGLPPPQVRVVKERIVTKMLKWLWGGNQAVKRPRDAGEEDFAVPPQEHLPTDPTAQHWANIEQTQPLGVHAIGNGKTVVVDLGGRARQATVVERTPHGKMYRVQYSDGTIATVDASTVRELIL